MLKTRFRNSTLLHLVLLLMISVPLALTGCGGGDGDDDGGGGGGLLDGTFYGGSIYSDNWSSFYRITFDDSNGFDHEEVFTSEDDTSSGAGSITATGDGQFSVTSPEGETLHGAYDRDRDVIGIMDPDWSNGVLGLNMAVKQTSGLPPDELDDRCYRFVEHWGDSDTIVGTACFDADTSTYTHTANSNGLPLDAGTSDYTLSPNGQLSLTQSGVEWAKGMISPDREFGVFTQTQVSGGDVHFGAMIQFSFGLTLASLDGTYNFFVYEGDWVGTIEVTFNGDGTFTGHDLVNSDNDLVPIGGTYTVDDNGFLTVNVSGSGEVFIGMVQFDAHRIILADLGGDEDTSIAVGFLRP